MDRLVQGIHHALRRLQCGLGAVDLLQHDGEFVVADPADGVGFTRALPEAPGNLLQQQVSDLRTDLAVHRIEAVQVQVQQGNTAVGAPRTGQGQLQTVLEQQPVCQARQAVLVRQPVQLASVVPARQIQGEKPRQLGKHALAGRVRKVVGGRERKAEGATQSGAIVQRYDHARPFAFQQPQQLGPGIVGQVSGVANDDLLLQRKSAPEPRGFGCRQRSRVGGRRFGLAGPVCADRRRAFAVFRAIQDRARGPQRKPGQPDGGSPAAFGLVGIAAQQDRDQRIEGQWRFLAVLQRSDVLQVGLQGLLSCAQKIAAGKPSFRGDGVVGGKRRDIQAQRLSVACGGRCCHAGRVLEHQRFPAEHLA